MRVIIGNSGNIIVNTDNIDYSISSSHINYSKIKHAILDGKFSELVNLIDINKSILTYTSESGFIKINNGEITYKNVPVDNYISEKIIKFMKDGLKFKPLLNFLENLLLNPSYRAVQELYKFIEIGNFEITSDGHFIAFKAVASNYRDYHSGKFDNTPGKTVCVSRNLVDEDSYRSCSFGLHVGTLEYAKNFGSCKKGHLVSVKVNPKYAVSVPNNDCSKLRVCEYFVLKDVT